MKGRGFCGRDFLILEGGAWFKSAMLIGCQEGGGGDHMTPNPFSPSLKLGLVLIDGKKMNGS